MKKLILVVCVGLGTAMHVGFASAAWNGQGQSGSGSEGVEIEESVEGYAPDIDFSADDGTGRLRALGETCNRWWINGSHTYKWRYYIFAGYNQISASSTTTYGGMTGSCGIPLVVDSLSVKGNTLSIHSFPAVINKTAHNVSYVDASSKTNWVGNGNKACGAIVTHTAVKNGVTWKTVSKSGCAR